MSSRPALVAALVLVLSAAGFVTPASAADPTVTCTGFVTCTAQSRSNFGYSSVIGQRHWFQAAGHNCTNYVAYRLIGRDQHIAQPAGTVDGRGAAGWYDAAVAAGVKTFDTPQAGDVAWWPARYNKASATGHVAYVESVGGDGTITVSEDNASGDFQWREVSPTSGYYPKKFLRFVGTGDGSPVVDVSITSPRANTVRVSGYARDPDAPASTLAMKLTVGGESRSFASGNITFTAEFASSTWRGPMDVRLTVPNVTSTDGGDKVVNAPGLYVKKPATISASFADPTVTTSQTPKIVFKMVQSDALGVVSFKRGSTTLKTLNVYASTKRPVAVTLPKQSRGTKTLTVYYRGSTTYAPVSKNLTLRVR